LTSHPAEFRNSWLNGVRGNRGRENMDFVSRLGPVPSVMLGVAFVILCLPVFGRRRSNCWSMLCEKIRPMVPPSSTGGMGLASRSILSLVMNSAALMSAAVTV